MTEEKNKKVLVTGAAGFIGHHLSKLLAKNGYMVIGIDNINDYYDQNLKLARLHDMGIDTSNMKENMPMEGDITFVKLDLKNADDVMQLFKKGTIRLCGKFSCPGRGEVFAGKSAIIYR